jgi:hypothetical protein
VVAAEGLVLGEQVFDPFSTLGPVFYVCIGLMPVDWASVSGKEDSDQFEDGTVE